MRVSARVGVSAWVGVSAQGCGKKAGSKLFNSTTAQGSESPHSVRRVSAQCAETPTPAARLGDMSSILPHQTCGTAGACITGSTAVLWPGVGRCS